MWWVNLVLVVLGLAVLGWLTLRVWRQLRALLVALASTSASLARIGEQLDKASGRHEARNELDAENLRATVTSTGRAGTYDRA